MANFIFCLHINIYDILTIPLEAPDVDCLPLTLLHESEPHPCDAHFTEVVP